MMDWGERGAATQRRPRAIVPRPLTFRPGVFGGGYPVTQGKLSVVKERHPGIVERRERLAQAFGIVEVPKYPLDPGLSAVILEELKGSGLGRPSSLNPDGGQESAGAGCTD